MPYASSPSSHAASLGNSCSSLSAVNGSRHLILIIYIHSGSFFPLPCVLFLAGGLFNPVPIICSTHTTLALAMGPSPSAACFHSHFLRPCQFQLPHLEGRGWGAGIFAETPQGRLRVLQMIPGRGRDQHIPRRNKCTKHRSGDKRGKFDPTWDGRI